MAKEIPQNEWPKFLTDFTSGNEGRLARIDIDGKHIGDGEGEELFVLTGVESGVQAEDEDTVVVELADMEGREQGHVTHRFEDVNALRLQEAQGKTEGLEIETRDGKRAVLHLEEGMSTTA